jgi:hypothetical protein
MHFYILRGRYVGVTSSRHSLLTREGMLHVRLCVGDRPHAAGTHGCVVVVVRCQIQIGRRRWKESRDSYWLTAVKRSRRVESCQSCNTLQHTRRWQSGFGILIPTLFDGMAQDVHTTALPPHFLQHGATLEVDHALLHVLQRRMLPHLIWILMFRKADDKNWWGHHYLPPLRMEGGILARVRPVLDNGKEVPIVQEHMRTCRFAKMHLYWSW